MTINEAIKHCEEVAERYERMEDSHDDKLKEECLQCAADHRQLAEWLTELKELKEENKVLMSECDRLIKEKGKLVKSNEDMKELLLKACNDIYHYVDCFESHCDECCCSHDDKCHWKHEAEVLKLLEENGESNKI